MAEGLIPGAGGSAEKTEVGDRQGGESPRSGLRRGFLRPGEIYDPVGRALDVIGDRWSLVLVRHLLLGPKGFQDLRMRTGIAPRVLSQRLRQLAERGFVESARGGARSPYQLTGRGRTLEPIVAAIARWFTREGFRALEIDASRYTHTSPQSVLEALPFLLREDASRDARVTFEIRLTGEGGGVWSVRIDHGTCQVVNDFAEGADVRYTADAKMWCAVALGLMDARDAMRQGWLSKEGSHHAMDHYFHQISRGDHEGRPEHPEAHETQSESEGESK